jgi:cytochrome c oxidase subunit 2
MNLMDVFQAFSISEIGFQDSAAPSMDGIYDLHYHINSIIAGIFAFVLVMFGYVYITFVRSVESPANSKELANRSLFYRARRAVENEVLEITWTSIPIFTLFYLGLPSFALLYSMDEVIGPWITLQVIGSQWYWSYEYSDSTEDAIDLFGMESPEAEVMYFRFIEMDKAWRAFTENESMLTHYDSYMKSTEDLEKGQFRLLEVDKNVVLPIDLNIKFLVTAADVLHSFSVNSLGIKIDAVPGRLNQTSAYIRRPGVYYGQCSELCGANHGFMPIVIKAVPFHDFRYWCFVKSMHTPFEPNEVGFIDSLREFFFSENLAVQYTGDCYFIPSTRPYVKALVDFFIQPNVINAYYGDMGNLFLCMSIITKELIRVDNWFYVVKFGAKVN